MSEEEIIAGIQECAQHLGRVPRFLDFQQFKGIKAGQVLNTFGSWGRALRAADMEQDRNRSRLSKEAAIKAIEECADALGRVPTQAECKAKTGISEYTVLRLFGNWSKALRACGMKPNQGSPVNMDAYFKDWAEMVREIGRFPTSVEYAINAHHSAQPLRQRAGRWSGVPGAFAEYAIQHGLEHEWADVLEIIRRQTMAGAETSLGTSRWTSSATSTQTSTGKVPAGIGLVAEAEEQAQNRRIYGVPLTPMPLAYAPINEMGVVFLFGALARRLGFVVTQIGGAFPDCEAMREVTPGRLQQVLIEFEYESRNFLRHMHNATECDLIVCWTHNWPECPLEVIELSRVDYVQQMLAAR